MACANCGLTPATGQQLPPGASPPPPTQQTQPIILAGCRVCWPLGAVAMLVLLSLTKERG